MKPSMTWILLSILMGLALWPLPLVLFSTEAIGHPISDWLTTCTVPGGLGRAIARALAPILYPHPFSGSPEPLVHRSSRRV